MAPTPEDSAHAASHQATADTVRSAKAKVTIWANQQRLRLECEQSIREFVNAQAS
jgi:hypothetical protein